MSTFLRFFSLFLLFNVTLSAPPRRSAHSCPTNTDSDSDGFLDCLDGCPRDGAKTHPGVCGCGIADIDSDGDAVPDCVDECPADAAKAHGGFCGCHSDEGHCGCNVRPLHGAGQSCDRVQSSRLPTADHPKVTYTFAPAGTALATLSLRHGALPAALGGDAPSLDLIFAFAADSGVLSFESLDKRSHTVSHPAHAATPSGILLSKAARVCLPRPAGADNLADYCLAFADLSAGGVAKCFDAELEVDAKTGLVCGAAALLGSLSVTHREPAVSMTPSIRSVSPSVCPASGACELTVRGTNFNRGLLTSVHIGDASLDVDSCAYSASEIVCSPVPAGQGRNLPVELEFTNHLAADMVASVVAERAFSYEAPSIHAVHLDPETSTLRVVGKNFGPARTLHAADGDFLSVDDDLCENATVAGDGSILYCTVPSRTMEKRSAHGDSHPVRARVHMGGHVAHSLPAHYVRNCVGHDLHLCQDNTCVYADEACPVSPSGWARCPLEKPVIDLTAGTGACLDSSVLVAGASPDSYEVTLDGTATHLPVGPFTLRVVDGSAPSGSIRFAVSLRTSDGAAPAVSPVLRVESQGTWSKEVVVSVSVAEGENVDPFGLCLGRRGDTGKWVCVDEALEQGSAEVRGTAPVLRGVNYYALITDNCPGQLNPAQADADGDGVGDACPTATGASAVDDCRDRSAGNAAFLDRIMDQVGPIPVPEEKECNNKVAHSSLTDRRAAANAVAAEHATHSKRSYEPRDVPMYPYAL